MSFMNKEDRSDYIAQLQFLYKELSYLQFRKNTKSFKEVHLFKRFRRSIARVRTKLSMLSKSGNK